MKSKTKAVAFLRVSSHRQRDNTSHETQESEMLKYAAENALEVVQVFRLTESAKDSERRTQYCEGMAWAKRNKVRHVIFYVFDRETRNLTDNEANENLVRSGDMVIHYAKEKRIYHSDTNDSDFFLRDVQAVTNKHYIRQHRTKVIDAMRTKAEAGHYPGNHPPLGYVNARLKDEAGAVKRRGTVVVRDPNEKKVRQVQREFELRSCGYSCEQVRTQVIQEGFISPLKIQNYTRSGIEKRLRNKFYSGEFTWQDKTYNGKHELIIDENTLSLVRESFGARGYQRKSSAEHGKLSGGFLKCADPKCACHIVYDPKTKVIVKTGETKTFHYYRCTNAKRIHARIRYAREVDVWSSLERALDDIALDEALAAMIAKGLNESFSELRAQRKSEIAKYRGVLASLEEREDRAYSDHVSGTLSADMYTRQIAKVRDERKRYTDLLESANDEADASALESAQSAIELAKDAKSLWLERSADERVSFLKLILSNCRWNGVTVEYDLKKPWSTLKEMKQNGEWWPLGYRFITECRLIAV